MKRPAEEISESSSPMTEPVRNVDGPEKRPNVTTPESLGTQGEQPKSEATVLSPEKTTSPIQETETLNGDNSTITCKDQESDNEEGCPTTSAQTLPGEALGEQEEETEQSEESSDTETTDGKSEIGEDDDWAELMLDDQDPESALDDSPARLEWLAQKREGNEQNEHLDRMMSMVGHEEVKAHFLDVKTKVNAAKRLGDDLKKLNFDLILQGNHGTGKKRIAQLYAEFLYSVGVVSRRSFQRTTKYVVPPQGTSTVLFFAEADKIDRAYEVANIVKEIRKRKDNVVLIFSYRQLSEASVNALKGSLEALLRLPEPIRLRDYTEAEAKLLLRRLIEKRSLKFEGGLNDRVLSYLARRGLRSPDDIERSNIRALDAEVDLLRQRRSMRYMQEILAWAKAHPLGKETIDESGLLSLHDRPQKRLLIEADVFGPEPTDLRDHSAAWKELQKMVGLESVKKEISHLFNIAKINYHRAVQGRDIIPMNLNRTFVGASGVGKTTVAKLYGTIIGELGLVSKGEVILKSPSDLIGTVIGRSEMNTKEVLEKAMGNVLIIDDAHNLYQGANTNNLDMFHRAIISTLVANISGKPGEDRCVIMVGFEDKMEQMFLESNPGLQRRFNGEGALHFEVYNEEQLCEILDAKLAEDGSVISDQGRQVAREMLSRARIRPGFGNGGDVENLLVRAKLRQRQRLEAAGIDRFELLHKQQVLEPEDFDTDHDRVSRADSNRDALFEGFVGFDKITKQFQEYQQMANGMRRLNIDPRSYMPWAFVFKGPPGTGKTSTARKVGKLFYDMGFLSTDEVITCSATDLIGTMQGQTGPKVINQLEKAIGKVLFIDEAYRLATNPSDISSINFKADAIGEMVDAMSRPRYAGNMIIILAGYTEDMERLLSSNQGLRGRFPTVVDFPRIDSYSCLLLLKQELDKVKIGIEIPSLDKLGDDQWKEIFRILEKLRNTKGWANGRDIKTLATKVITDLYIKVGKAGADWEIGPMVVSVDEAVKFLENMLVERQGNSGRRRILS